MLITRVQCQYFVYDFKERDSAIFTVINDMNDVYKTSVYRYFLDISCG